MSNTATLLIGAVAKTNRVTTEPHTTWTSLPFINIVTRGKQRGEGMGVRENINEQLYHFLKQLMILCHFLVNQL